MQMGFLEKVELSKCKNSKNKKNNKESCNKIKIEDWVKKVKELYKIK